MADLSPDRVTLGMPPFSFVGVDYFGPFTVKGGRWLSQTVWCSLYMSCAKSYTYRNFPHSALRRFIARRGAVIEIRSDNATNFVGAEKELKILMSGIKLLITNFFCRSKSSGFLTPLLLLTMLECGSVVFVLFEKY